MHSIRYSFTCPQFLCRERRCIQTYKLSMDSNNQQSRHELAPHFTKKIAMTFNTQQGWQRLVKDIVRPPRSIYADADLGSSSFVLNQTRYHRIDMDVKHQTKKISVTLYKPEVSSHWLILYLHGNSASRFQAISLLRHLPFKFSLACFDFIGCGLNEQADSISLGHRQSDQVSSVVKKLQEKGFRVAVWGRSMGAATALKYGKAPIIVADSSFTDFKELCRQLAIHHAPTCIPKCLISCIFPCFFAKLRQDVKETGNYDIETLNILEAVAKIKDDTCLIFMSGDADNLINRSHSELLHSSFSGKQKHLQIFPGSHNSRRPAMVLDKIMRLIGELAEGIEKKAEITTQVKIEVHHHQE